MDAREARLPLNRQGAKEPCTLSVLALGAFAANKV